MKLKIEYSKIFGGVSIVLIISLFASLIVLFDYSDSLKIELANRDSLIENLNKKDSILQESIKVVDTIRSGKSEVNISELVKYANSLSDEILQLHKKINSLNDSVRYYKIYHDLSQRYFNHKYVVTSNASGGRNYSLDPNAVKKNVLEECQAKYNKSERENIKLKNQISEYQQVLKWYGIQLNAKNENESIVFSSPYYAPKIDSAFILLEVYRDKLKYNKENKSWKVGNRVTFTTIKSSTVNTSKIDTVVYRNPQPVSEKRIK